MLGNDFVDFSRLLIINDDTLLKILYQPLYSKMVMDNYSNINFHLLSVIITNDKFNLEYGKPYIEDYNRTNFNILFYIRYYI
jgi:hypothetical protein